ncbi:MAG: carboxypeptidase regulatory-like domain-containing protein [Gammaproteobacteria bacterium]|nr:carboxypeptidase regulatory-like domain-containing protein [Gammaproteobacteria bacterium]
MLNTKLLTSLPILLLASFFFCTTATAQDNSSTNSDDDKPKMLELWSPGDSGQRMRIRGRVVSADGSPVPNVTIRFRHADSEGIDRSYHQGELTTNERGVYQFGSVIPGNNHRLSHVHVYISHPGFRYLETEFYFKDDPKADADDPNAIFLEEGTTEGEKMMYGRWDVTLTPE